MIDCRKAIWKDSIYLRITEMFGPTDCLTISEMRQTKKKRPEQIPRFFKP